MAEVRKKEKVKKYNIDELSVKGKEKSKELEKKQNKQVAKKNSTNKKPRKDENRNLWIKFRVFCHGVKSEFLKVHWPTKNEMARYSIATIFFVVFLSLFFYLIDVIFALIQSIF